MLSLTTEENTRAIIGKLRSYEHDMYSVFFRNEGGVDDPLTAEQGLHDLFAMATGIGHFSPTSIDDGDDGPEPMEVSQEDPLPVPDVRGTLKGARY